MSVQVQLDQAKEGFIATAPEEVQSALFRHIKEQQGQSSEFHADQSAWQTSESV